MKAAEKTDRYQKFYDLAAPVQTLVRTPDAYTGPTYRAGDHSYETAVNTLAFHFDGDDDDGPCCTEAQPCDTAAFYLLATGQAGATSGTLTRDDDRSTGLDKQSRPRGNGNASTGKPPRSVMTPKQAEFFEALCAEITELATAAGKQTYVDAVVDFRAEMTMTGEYAGKRPSFEKVSWTIDFLKRLRAADARR